MNYMLWGAGHQWNLLLCHWLQWELVALGTSLGQESLVETALWKVSAGGQEGKKAQKKLEDVLLSLSVLSPNYALCIPLHPSSFQVQISAAMFDTLIQHTLKSTGVTIGIGWGRLFVNSSGQKTEWRSSDRDQGITATLNYIRISILGKKYSLEVTEKWLGGLEILFSQ